MQMRWMKMSQRLLMTWLTTQPSVMSALMMSSLMSRQMMGSSSGRSGDGVRLPSGCRYV